MKKLDLHSMISRWGYKALSISYNKCPRTMTSRAFHLPKISKTQNFLPMYEQDLFFYYQLQIYFKHQSISWHKCDCSRMKSYIKSDHSNKIHLLKKINI